VKGRDAETPRIVAERTRQIRASVASQRLWLAADCGYSRTARPLAVERMRSLVAGARMVREELDRA
jgi:methionine synthase II (cobalamin-independent)